MTKVLKDFAKGFMSTFAVFAFLITAMACLYGFIEIVTYFFNTVGDPNFAAVLVILTISTIAGVIGVVINSNTGEE